jgi:hypothetical protein
MTAPHPALLQLVRGDPIGPIGNEEALLQSAFEHRLVAGVQRAHEEGRLRLARSTVTTATIWNLAERSAHLKLWSAIDTIERALAPRAVEVCVLKGVATEARWFDGMGHRVTTDVDLLLDPASVGRTAEVIQALDPNRGQAEAIEWLIERRLLQHVDLRLGNIQVDLHLDPLKIGIPTRQLDEVWASTQLLETDQGTIRVLGAEHELVLLLMHLNKDRFAFLGSFLDVRHIIERGNIDWEVFEAFVAEEGLTIPVYCSLAAVASLLRLDIEAPTVRGLRAWSWERLWGPRVRLQGTEGRERAPAVQRWLPLHVTGRSGAVLREQRRQRLPPRQLLEVAGRLEPDERYWRAAAFGRTRGRPRQQAAKEAPSQHRRGLLRRAGRDGNSEEMFEPPVRGRSQSVEGDM